MRGRVEPKRDSFPGISVPSSEGHAAHERKQMKRGKRKVTVRSGEQFDMFDAKQAPVARLTMRDVWDDWSRQYIPLRGTTVKEELDYAV